MRLPEPVAETRGKEILLRSNYGENPGKDSKFWRTLVQRQDGRRRLARYDSLRHSLVHTRLTPSRMHTYYYYSLALGCAGSLVLINQVFGTDPIGRTVSLFGTFFVQEGKRKIKVDDMIGIRLDTRFVTYLFTKLTCLLRYLQ